MAEKINRRSFMKKSALASAATAVGLSYKNRSLSAEPAPGGDRTILKKSGIL